MRTLHLTSPPMTGPDVTNAQILLSGNVFNQNYQPGPLDGVCGEQTARAFTRAHYWVGDAKPQPTMGDRLTAFLNGQKPLPHDNVVRRAQRLKDAAAKPLRMVALELLTGKLGVKEQPPQSNICWASEWYGAIGPWCAMAVSWAYVQAGSRAFKRGAAYAYVPFIVNDARAGRNGLAITHDPKPGDLVCYDWERNGVPDHVGLYEKATGPDFTAIEGNTSLGNNSNGGEVMRRTRHKTDVCAFIHVAR